jgi:hypothetical protein
LKVICIGGIWNIWIRVYTEDKSRQTSVDVDTVQLNRFLCASLFLECIPQTILQFINWNGTKSGYDSQMLLISVSLGLFRMSFGVFRYVYWIFIKSRPLDYIPIGIKIKFFRVQLIIPKQSKKDREAISLSEDALGAEARSLEGDNMSHYFPDDDDRASLSGQVVGVELSHLNIDKSTEHVILPIDASADESAKDKLVSVEEESDSDSENSVYISKKILRKNKKSSDEIKISFSR